MTPPGEVSSSRSALSAVLLLVFALLESAAVRAESSHDLSTADAPADVLFREQLAHDGPVVVAVADAASPWRGSQRCSSRGVG